MKLVTEYLHTSCWGSYWTQAEVLTDCGELCEVQFYDELLDTWVTRMVERDTLRTTCVDLTTEIVDELTATLTAKLSELLPDLPAGMAAAIKDDVRGALLAHR